jgi:phosphoserine phosphatase
MPRCQPATPFDANPEHRKTQKVNANAKQFINSVLRLAPKLAVFDCDGTLWSGDAGENFFDWELNQGLVAEETVRWARARYADYRAAKVSEDDMCANMVSLHRGLTEAEVQQVANNYFEQYCVPWIFSEMQRLVHDLQAAGADVWAVSSTNEWVIRAGIKHFGIPETKILAASVGVVEGKITDQIIRIPSGAGKPKAIREVVQRPPDAAFGNSIWDADMLALAKHPFVVNPTPELNEIARQRRWPVYQPNSSGT